MTTRWFVEVSRVDADTQKERYCVEALQWQQALQQARKLRGDRGALSRFAIELLDSGYRATDPGARLRYTISKAPNDAPLSDAHASNGSSKPSQHVAPPAVPSEAPSLPRPAVSASPPAASASKPAASLPKPAASASKAPAGASKPAGPVAIPRPASTSARPPSVAPAHSAPSEAPRRAAATIATSPAVPNPRRSNRPRKVMVKTSPSEPAPAPASVEPPALTPTTELDALDPMTEPPAETAPEVPGLELVAMRKEEPTEAIPITYREYSFAVAPGTDPEELERHARAAWEQVRTAILSRTSQKFVQIALFDHKFEGRPERPPVAVLAWKDWRGDPVFQIRSGSVPPPPLSGAPAAWTAASAAPAPAPVPEPPVPVPVPVPVPDPAPAPAVADPVPVPAPDPASAAPSFPSPPAAAPPAPPAPKSEPRSKTPSRPGSSPGIRKKRASSEDLIGELFEQMHQVHFAPDLVSGADYVLGVLRVMPCEAALIHVFDINTRQFVVVRASGPNPRNVLLHRTPDTYSLFRSVFRRGRSISFPDAANDANFQGGRWERLGVTVKAALCGAVKQGGRYLGVIELVNPVGNAAFQETEMNALDYICEQFADFVASRPVVIDEDAVLPRT